MSITRWFKRSVSRTRTQGRKGARRSAIEFRDGLVRRVDPHVPGTGIFEREWDVLVLLDACRPDLLAEVAASYDFLPPSPQTVYSKASNSWLWMERNFTDAHRAEMARTAYVTGNPFSDEYVEGTDFALVDEVWRYAWDRQRGTVPARPITDRAISVARAGAADRMLVHYMQPHFPSIPDPVDSGIDIEAFGEGWDSVWDDLRAGEVSVETVWNAYRANLEYVLDDVGLLLDSVNGERVVISSDHGNALGEFGFYGHPPYVPLPNVRRVPWVETTASDRGEHEPAEYSTDRGIADEELRSRLRDLGYV